MILLSSLVALRLMLVLLLLFEPAFPVEEVAAGRSSTTTPNDGELLKRRVLRSRGGGGGNNNNKQVKIFILAGGDNMLGYASLPHLRALVQREADHNSNSKSNKDDNHNSTIPRKKQQQKHYLYTHLVDGEGNWRIRDNVFVVHEGEQAGGIQASPYHFGPLDPKGGFGAAIHRFGPEVEFGHVMGNVYSRNPVVLVKAAWSGRKTTLARDFRSPSSSSSSSSTTGKTGTTAGFQWFRLLSNLQWTVDHLGDILGAARPEESSSSYEQQQKKPKQYQHKLMGVIWWHGYRDLQDSPMAVMEYRDNLVHFCRDLRRTFRDPYLPILIGELGGRGRLLQGSMTEPEREEFEFRQMQRQGVQALSPTMSNQTGSGTAATTRFVPTARFVKKRASPEDVRMLFHENATHYYGRADTMIDVGRAFATQFLDVTYNGNQGGSGSGSRGQASSSSSSKGAMETFFRNKDMNFRLRLMIYVILSLMVLVLGFAFCSQGGFTPSNVQDSFKTTVRLFAEGQAGEEEDDDDDDDDDQEYDDEDHVEVVSFDKDGELFVEEAKDSS